MKRDRIEMSLPIGRCTAGRSIRNRLLRRSSRFGCEGRTQSAIRNRFTGLTLIELLVVIAIISIIVSAIVVASFSALKAGQIRGTRGVMEKIALALAQYKLEYGMYIPSGVNGLPDNRDAGDAPVIADSTYPLWQALEHDGKYASIPAANKLAGTADPYPDGPSVRYKYIDAWKQPLWYECDGPDYTKFKLTSGGPDLIFGTASEDAWGDNIVIE